MGQASAGVGFAKPRYPTGSGVEQDAVAGACGSDADPDSETGFPVPVGRAGPRSGFLHKDTGAQVCDEVPVRGRLLIEVELSSGLCPRNPSLA
jgi:hypothetical protein